MNNKLIALLLFGCTSLMAQDINLNVVASGGDYATTASGSISYTIGQPISETVGNANNKITQGFQQADKHEAKVVLHGAIFKSSNRRRTMDA